jgi:uncharacterized protein YqhQ
MLYSSVVLALAFTIGIFIILPTGVVNLLKYVTDSVFWLNFVEGVLRIALFVAYVWAVSYVPDIRRTFQYHGAEHKTIFCYEAGLPLTVENVRKQSRFHPRCGTSFMILILIVSIFVTFILDAIIPWLKGVLWLRTIIKILLIPVICGIGYELIRVCGKYDNVITRVVAAPGLWIQRITVKEPDDSMIEIAVAAMNEVIPENEEEAKWK